MVYQIKTRWITEGATTLWKWGLVFKSLEEAASYKEKYQGQLDYDDTWTLDIEIYRVEKVV